MSRAVPRLSACHLEPGSRVEAKGGGAPTGMSATAAVAGKPRYTRPAYPRGVAQALARCCQQPDTRWIERLWGTRGPGSCSRRNNACPDGRGGALIMTSVPPSGLAGAARQEKVSGASVPPPNLGGGPSCDATGSMIGKSARLMQLEPGRLARLARLRARPLPLLR